MKKIKQLICLNTPQTASKSNGEHTIAKLRQLCITHPSKCIYLNHYNVCCLLGKCPRLTDIAALQIMYHLHWEPRLPIPIHFTPS